MESHYSTIQFMRAGQLPSMPGPPVRISQTNALLHFSWTEPFDNGGSEIKDYDVQIVRVIDNDVKLINVINAREFKFTPADGLLAGFEYLINVRAKNFYTKYFSLLAPFGAKTTFFTSILPQTVS